jgi:hypothetical protein
MFEAKKPSDTSFKKIPKKNNVESFVKKNPKISQRSNQTEATSTSQPNTFAQRTMIEK